jgi:hypothetical protein
MEQSGLESQVVKKKTSTNPDLSGITMHQMLLAQNIPHSNNNEAAWLN